MKNVLLLGIYGTYNYGCEAIVRGTVEILKRYNPDINISYASYDYQTDIKKLRDLDINIIKRPNIFKKWSLQNIKWKILRLLNVTRTRPFDTTDWIQNFDTIFSIGGDMYTLGSDNSYKKSLPKFFEECKQKGLKYILWGASVGPFDKNPEALQFYKSHLANADLIVSREEATTSYLEKIEINDNVTFAPDPAFYVPGPIKNISSSNEITQIGINLSYLSATHTYPTIEEAINKQAQTIEMIIDQFDCNITLLPHVVSPRYWEDDTAYLQKVKDAVNPSKQKKSL